MPKPVDRRTILGAAAAIAAAPCASGAAQPRRIAKIATEECFQLPEVAAAITRYMAVHGDEEPGLDQWRSGYRTDPASELGRKLFDFDQRLRDMDADGIDMQLIGLSAPGVQMFGAAEGTELARLVNDRAAEIVRRHPGRFQALANIAPQDPQAAARECVRCIETLGFKGVIVNSHSKGHYLDEPQFRPLLQTIERLGVPLYIHPREPAPQMLGPYRDYAMRGALWGYAADTGLHAMRMILSGLFDALPGLRVILGHLGEGVPFFLDRIDNRVNSPTNRPGKVPLQRPPGAYFRENFWITTSGMNWEPAVRFCQAVLGPDRVMFAADYPFENQAAAVARVDAMRMPDAERELLYNGNARSVFRL